MKWPDGRRFLGKPIVRPTNNNKKIRAPHSEKCIPWPGHSFGVLHFRRNQCEFSALAIGIDFYYVIAFRAQTQGVNNSMSVHMIRCNPCVYLVGVCARTISNNLFAINSLGRSWDARR